MLNICVRKLDVKQCTEVRFARLLSGGFTTMAVINPPERKLAKRHLCALWQYRLWSFQTRGTKLERFLPKNQHTQRKLLNFENWISGGLRSFQKSEF